jgi:hypothetical protein
MAKIGSVWDDGPRKDVYDRSHIIPFSWRVPAKYLRTSFEVHRVGITVEQCCNAIRVVHQ